MSWTLTTQTNAVVLPDPAAEYETWTEKSQALARTAAGAVRVYSRDLTSYRARVVWRDLTDAEKQALATFFRNAPGATPPGVDGMACAFTLTDHAGASATARFAAPELRFSKSLSNRWNATVEILLDRLLD